MSFVHVLTLRDGTLARPELYSDRDEALAAAGALGATLRGCALDEKRYPR